MASKVEDGRKAYICRPKEPQPEKPQPAKKRTRIKPVSKKRAKENREHDQIHKNFMQNNPRCDCGCGELSEHRHHIASGSAGRPLSLFDTDTQLAVAGWCHDEKFADFAAYPIARQVAMKWVAVLRKLNRYRGRAENAITLAEVVSYLDVDWNEVAEIIRKRKEG